MTPLIRSAFLMLVVCAWLAPVPVRAQAQDPSARVLPEYSSVDPDAPPVTLLDIAQREKFWPYRVALTEALTVGEKTLKVGLRGVLVTIRGDGMARVDFGRDGRFEVPLGKTDAVAAANAVRTGERFKFAPNFVHTIGTRMVDLTVPEDAGFSFKDLFPIPGYVAVYADLPTLEKLAPKLKPLDGLRDVRAMLFPHGDEINTEIRDRLLAKEWPAAFVLNRFAEGYTRSRIPDGASLPYVMVLSPEGRVLLEEPWTDASAAKVKATIEGAFPEPAPVAAAETAP